MKQTTAEHNNGTNLYCDGRTVFFTNCTACTEASRPIKAAFEEEARLISRHLSQDLAVTRIYGELGGPHVEFEFRGHRYEVKRAAV